jgi:hypothetical protein
VAGFCELTRWFSSQGGGGRHATAACSALAIDREVVRGAVASSYTPRCQWARAARPATVRSVAKRRTILANR